MRQNICALVDLFAKQLQRGETKDCENDVGPYDETEI